LENIFPLWQWVSGRFSVWSSAGLPAMIALGREKFTEFLRGAEAMDQHFSTASLDRNLPVQLALTGLWHINFENLAALAIVPYADRLAELVPYLQQVEMESNGKSVNRDEQWLDYQTAPFVFGYKGPAAQHSFFQQLH